MYCSRPVVAEDVKLANISYSSGIELEDLDIPAEERDVKITSILDEYHEKLEDRTRYHLGYPYNLDFNMDELAFLQKYSINNLGDPWVCCHSHLL